MNLEALQQFVDHTDGRLEALQLLNYQPFASELANISTQFREFKQGAQQLLAEGETLQIGIVGQVKAGKSSFLNALFFNGEHVLPRASTPMTAGLTILEYGEQNTFEVEYFAKDDWQHFEEQYRVYKRIEEECRKEVEAEFPNDAPPHILQQKIEENTTESDRSAAEMVEACGSAARAKIGSANEVVPFESIANLQEVLERYVGANGAYTSVVKSLHVKLKDERLRGIRIVDTPGVNDPVLSRENRTRTFLYACHGVFLLSASSDFLGSQDVQFLNTRVGEQGIAKVVVLASKFDSVLQDLGAEREMKGQPSATLEVAAEQQQRAFLKRLDSLKTDIVERLRNDLVLSYTSGISYALAHKAEATWDDAEKQVARQMKRYYPANFATPEQARESYIALANIEDIYNDYLDGVFKQNKEAIISAKITGFMEANIKALQTQVSQVGNLVGQRYKDLQEKDLAAVEKQIEAQEKLFKKIENRFAADVSDFSSGLQTKMEELRKDIPWSYTMDLNKTQESRQFRCKGIVWGTNTFTYKCNVINKQDTKKVFEKTLTEYLGKLKERWRQQFEDLKKKFEDSALKTIAEGAEEFATSDWFSDDYYRLIVKRSLNQATVLVHELQTDELLRNFMRACANGLEDFNPKTDYSKKSKEEMVSGITEAVRDYNAKIEKYIESLLSAVSDETKKAVNAKLTPAIEEIKKLEKTFAAHVQQNSKDYLQTLKAELQNKTESVRACESFKQVYEELAQTINNQRS